MTSPLERHVAHEIIVARPLAEALPLFTPKGEEAWVPGWRPTYVRPTTGETVEEMVFLTGEGAETTFWTCLAYEPEVGHVRYLRLTPGTRVAFVDVRCTVEDATTTRVRVAYDVLALSDEGRSFLEGFDETGFKVSIDAWSALIDALP